MALKWSRASELFRKRYPELGEACRTGLSFGQPGSVEPVSVFDSYVARLRQNIDFGAFTVVWDAGNGAAGPAVEALTSNLFLAAITHYLPILTAGFQTTIPIR